METKTKDIKHKTNKTFNKRYNCSNFKQDRKKTVNIPNEIKIKCLKKNK